MEPETLRSLLKDVSMAPELPKSEDPDSNGQTDIGLVFDVLYRVYCEQPERKLMDKPCALADRLDLSDTNSKEFGWALQALSDLLF